MPRSRYPALRVVWAKLRKGPTPADHKAVPPASADDWEKDGYLVSPLPADVAGKLGRRAKSLPRPRRRKGAAAEYGRRASVGG
jgi:hypothetical protein